MKHFHIACQKRIVGIFILEIWAYMYVKHFKTKWHWNSAHDQGLAYDQYWQCKEYKTMKYDGCFNQWLELGFAPVKLVYSRTSCLFFFLFFFLCVFYRTCQYSCKLVGWCLQQNQQDKDIIRKLKVLESAMSTTRKCKSNSYVCQ